jgi:hypothetical protein
MTQMRLGCQIDVLRRATVDQLHGGQLQLVKSINNRCDWQYLTGKRGHH